MTALQHVSHEQHWALRILIPVVFLLLSACGDLASVDPVDANSVIDIDAEGSISVRPLGCDVTPWQPKASIGIAHVAGAYGENSGEDFLLTGASAVAATGATTIKVYLTPNFSEVYPQAWPSGISNLKALAQTESFRTLFEQPFDTFILTTYSFAMGIGDPWRTQLDAARLEQARHEIEELTAYLLETYSGSNKTFVLQNWEGDWALLGSYDTTTSISNDTADRMAAWLNARHAGVSDARRRVTSDDVRVVHAVEVNRVLEASDTVNRVVNAVLPKICVDAVSYSAWEALGAEAVSLKLMKETITHRLGAAIAQIRHFVDDDRVAIYVGEFGFAENWIPEGIQVKQLIRHTVKQLQDLGVGPAVYWQVFDNECTSQGCLGLWVVRPDGHWSDAGLALMDLLESTDSGSHESSHDTDTD